MIRVWVIVLVVAAGLVASGGSVWADALKDVRAARTAVEKKEYDWAIELFTSAIDSYELSEDHQFAAVSDRAFAYFLNRQFDRALEAFGEAVDLKPDVARPYLGRGVAYFEMGQYEQAVAEFEEAIRIQPNNTEAIAAREKALAMIEAVPRAETAPKAEVAARADKGPRAVKANKSDGGTDLFNRGNAHLRGGRFDKAIRDYDEAIRLDPRNVLAYNNRGNAYVRKGQYEQAFADLNEALRLLPQWPETWNNRGNAYNQIGRYDDAIADLDEAIRFAPDLTIAYINRAVARNGIRQWDLAIADIDRALRLDPDMAEARIPMARAFNGKAWNLATTPDTGARDGQSAQRLAEEAVRLYADEPYLHGTLAATYAETGRFNDAFASQQRAIKLLQAAGRLDEAADFQSRLELYQNKQPYRQ